MYESSLRLFPNPKREGLAFFPPYERTDPTGFSSLADNPAADERRDDHTREVLSDVACKRLGIVNVAFYGKANAGRENWVSIDAASRARPASFAAPRKHGSAKPRTPAAILMTPGHFDHAGTLETLAAEWDPPVFGHELEPPYLNGTASYPPADPSVGGGLMAPLPPPLYPRAPYNVSR